MNSVNVTADIVIHGIEVVAIVFWAGVSYSDIRSLKADMVMLKNMVMQGFMRGAKE